MTENELLDLLAAELSIPYIGMDEVTARMLTDRAGIGDKQATEFLKRKEAAGELVSRRVRLPNGHVATAWRKAIAEVE